RPSNRAPRPPLLPARPAILKNPAPQTELKKLRNRMKIRAIAASPHKADLKPAGHRFRTFHLQPCPPSDTITGPLDSTMSDCYLHRISVVVLRAGVFIPSPVWREPA